MSGKKKILLIEQLNFITFAIYCLFYRNKTESTAYIDTSHLFGLVYKNFNKPDKKIFRDLHQIFHCDFLDSFYEQIEETGVYANDRLFDKYSENCYVSSVLKFGKNSFYSLALRKELYNRYTYNRVKTFIFLKHLSDTYDWVTFLPTDMENIIDLLSENQQPVMNYSIPQFFRYFLHLIDQVYKILAVIAYPFILLFIAIKFLFKGISIVKPKKKVYNYGIDTLSEGIVWRVPYNNFFIYNKSDFHPSKVLHVVRSALTDEKTKAKYRKYHYPCTIWNEQKTPIMFFFSRILVDMVLKQIKDLITGIVSCNKKSIFLLPCLAASKLIIEARIFYYYYDVKVFISRDEYSSLHVIRTLVAHENNAYTAGFMHGENAILGLESATNLYFDKYGIYGNFNRQRNEKGLAYANAELIGAGIYGLDKTFRLAQKGYVPDKYKEIKKSYKILLIFGAPYNVLDTESGFTKDIIIKYLNDILNLTDEYEDCYRVIKPAGDDRLDEDLKKIIAGHERVIIDKHFWTYKLFLISDLTFCYSSSTVGLESIMAGKKVIYYDLTGFMKHPYAKYSPGLVVRTAEDLKKNLNYILREKKYVDTATLELIRELHGYRFDGQVVHRFRQLCRGLLRSANREKNN